MKYFGAWEQKSNRWDKIRYTRREKGGEWSERFLLEFHPNWPFSVAVVTETWLWEARLITGNLTGFSPLGQLIFSIISLTNSHETGILVGAACCQQLINVTQLLSWNRAVRCGQTKINHVDTDLKQFQTHMRATHFYTDWTVGFNHKYATQGYSACMLDK